MVSNRLGQRRARSDAGQLAGHFRVVLVAVLVVGRHSLSAGFLLVLLTFQKLALVKLGGGK